MTDVIQHLKGANMDIDLASPANSIPWHQDTCPWNAAEKTDTHKCALKNVSLCPYFCGVEFLDTVCCCYPHSNPLIKDAKIPS